MATKAKLVTLKMAICRDSYEWLGRNAPLLLEAIRNEVQDGMDSDQVRLTVSHNVGPERQALAQRCEQAALWLTEYADS